MLVSWKWISEFIDLSSLKNGPEDFAKILTQRGIEVASIKSLGKGLEAVVTAKILDMKPHPDADRLTLCSIDYAGSEPFEVVCGAKNMKVNDVVALAHIGTTLPNGVTLKKSKIRGVVSNGMLCSEVEMGLSTESAGIMILPKGTKVGEPVVKSLGLDDTIIECEITPNRGDCLSHLGIAREMAAALGVKINYPKFELLNLSDKAPWTLGLDAGVGGPQFYACFIEGVTVGPSPKWLEEKLESIRQRSINNIVDATNFVLAEFGHPMHAYDADRLSGNILTIRQAEKGESLPLLDGDIVDLQGEELIISDKEKPRANNKRNLRICSPPDIRRNFISGSGSFIGVN